MDIMQEGLQKIIKNIGDADKQNMTASDNLSESFSSFYNKFKSCNSNVDHTTFETIPRLLQTPLEDNEESLVSKMQLETRTMFLQKIDDSLLNTEELESLKALLEQHSFPGSTGEKVIKYTSLKEVASKASHKCEKYFTPRVIAHFQNSEASDEICIVPLFTYAMRKTWLKKTRIGLSVYDEQGNGYLRESELESFIADLMPDCPQLSGLTKAFAPFYVCTVVRKFMFFLDPIGAGRIAIKDIMASTFLDDLLMLRNEKQDTSTEENWFSAQSALKVYGQYLFLDKDNNGMLNRSELAALGSGSITEVFIERVFQERLTYDGEMDYKGYLNLVLALENKREPQAMRYFFNIFDLSDKGYLDGFDLNYFFRGVQQKMERHQQERICFEDVKDELFDMVRPADPFKITMQDLMNSDQTEYFINILTDLNEFWNYENRGYN